MVHNLARHCLLIFLSSPLSLRICVRGSRSSPLDINFVPTSSFLCPIRFLICLGPTICHCAFVMVGFLRGIRNPQIQIDLWIATFSVLILALSYITLGSFACIRVCSVPFSRRTSWSDPWNTRVHADVSKVSQETIYGARKLHDRPRKLLSATESIVSRRCSKRPLRAFSKLPFSPSQVPFRRNID